MSPIGLKQHTMAEGSSPLRSTLNTNAITGLDMWKVYRFCFALSNKQHGSRVLARLAARGGLFARELQLVALLQTCAQFGPWHTRLQDHLDNTVRVVSGLTGAWAAENSKVAGRDRFVCFVFKDFMFASVENCLCRSRLLYWLADRGWIFLGEHDGCQLSKLPSFHPLVV